MRLRVGGVNELTGDKAAGYLLGELIRLGNGALHALCALGEHQFGAVSFHDLAAFDRHGLGHHDDYAVSARRGDRSKTYAGVARGRLDYDRTLVKQPARLGVVYHRLGDPVLYRACGIEIFKLCEDLCFEPEFLFYVCEFKQRGVTYKLVCRSVNT
ncbi:unknown [Anaerotruncus sp. CAG:390]|nr:unknown [Anaerotruncus sp. CAG:390]